MNFFEQQHAAQRRTGLLVVYFVLAVASIIAAINAVVFFAFAANAHRAPPAIADWVQTPMFGWITFATLGVIGIGTLKTSFQLRGGGRAVAEMVNARRF